MRARPRLHLPNYRTGARSMYVLITANRNYSSWSLRPWMLMKGLAIPFEDQVEPFTNPVNYDEFRSFSPPGQVPALLDDGRTAYASLGITIYHSDRPHTGSRSGRERGGRN